MTARRWSRRPRAATASCAPRAIPMNAETIAGLPASVRMIATFSVGYEHVDVAAAAKRSILVSNTPDVLTDATADIAMLCLLGAARRAHEGAQHARTHNWVGWTPTQLMGVHVTGKRLGILGMGRIGQALADRARAFRMPDPLQQPHAACRPTSRRARSSTPIPTPCCRIATSCRSTRR